MVFSNLFEFGCTIYSNPKSFVNFLLPDRGFGEGWGGVKFLRLLQGLLYVIVPIFFAFGYLQHHPPLALSAAKTA